MPYGVRPPCEQIAAYIRRVGHLHKGVYLVTEGLLRFHLLHTHFVQPGSRERVETLCILHEHAHPRPGAGVMTTTTCPECRRCPACGLPRHGAPCMVHIKGVQNPLRLCALCYRAGLKAGTWDRYGRIPPAPEPETDDDPIVFVRARRAL